MIWDPCAAMPPSPKLTCVLPMVHLCDCFVEFALCTPLFAEGLSAWAMNKTRTQHSQAARKNVFIRSFWTMPTHRSKITFMFDQPPTFC